MKGAAGRGRPAPSALASPPPARDDAPAGLARARRSDARSDKSDDVNPASPKPTFALAGGGKGEAIDLEQILALFRTLTGREPTAEDAEETKAALEGRPKEGAARVGRGPGRSPGA